eukprot:9468417-Pyramimonas_sp.AAC.1
MPMLPEVAGPLASASPWSSAAAPRPCPPLSADAERFLQGGLAFSFWPPPPPPLGAPQPLHVVLDAKLSWLHFTKEQRQVGVWPVERDDARSPSAILPLL